MLSLILEAAMGKAHSEDLRQRVVAEVVAGASRRQTSIASAQRGWKAQPLGGSIGDGGSPSTGARDLKARGSAIGVAAMRARV